MAGSKPDIGRLISWFEFKHPETAGSNAVDSHDSGIVLGDVNSVGRIAGPRDLAAVFSPFTDKSRFDLAAGSPLHKLPTGMDFTIVGVIRQFNTDVLADENHLIDIGGAGGGIEFWTDNNDHTDFTLYSASSSVTVAGNFVDGSWIYFALRHDASGKQISIYDDQGGTLTLRNTNTYVFTDFVEPTAVATFAWPVGTCTQDLQCEFLCFWNAHLSEAEITWLWNSQNYRSYLELAYSSPPRGNALGAAIRRSYNMSDKNTYTSKQGALWIQPDGPNTRSYYLACHDLDDFDENLGDIADLIQCLDDNGDWQTLGFTENAPGIIDLNMGTYVGKSADRLEGTSCPFTLYAMLRCDGSGGVFTNYERLAIIKVGKVSTRGRQGWVRSTEIVETRQTFGAQALPPILDWFRMNGVRQTVTDTEALNDVSFCNQERCQGRCGAGSAICQDGSAVGDAAVASPGIVANVLDTDNGGGDGWPATATNPFNSGEDISAIVCFQSATGQNITRKIVARGETDVGNPAEIAYSDDDGATWTKVNVGITNGQFIPNDNSLFALDHYNIYAGTDDGFIYKSEDGGGTWTAQESGVLSSNDYHSIFFVDELNGWAGNEGGIVVSTNDGGTTWSAATSISTDIINGLWAHDSLRVFAVTDNADLYYSLDGGTSWTNQTQLDLDSTGDLVDIEFANEYVGAVLYNTSAPAGTVYFTFDGGYTWEAATGPTNSGLNSIYLCATDLLFAVGEVQGSTAMVAKYTPAS